MSGTAACVSLIDTSIFQMEGTFSFTSFAFYHLLFPFEQNFILIESKAAFIGICVYASTKIPVSFYGGELYMTVKDAVAEHFQELCRQRVICPNELANLAGVTTSTVYSLLNPARHQISITTIKKLCDDLDVTLGQFFECSLFDRLEQEMR